MSVRRAVKTKSTRRQAYSAVPTSRLITIYLSDWRRRTTVDRLTRLGGCYGRKRLPGSEAEMAPRTRRRRLASRTCLDRLNWNRDPVPTGRLNKSRMCVILFLIHYFTWRLSLTRRIAKTERWRQRQTVTVAFQLITSQPLLDQYPSSSLSPTQS